MASSALLQGEKKGGTTAAGHKTCSSHQPVADKSAPGQPTGPKPVYGKHAQLPVFASDNYAKIELPELQEWDPLGTLQLDATLVAIGKRRTGKTFLFRNIMYLLKDAFPACLCISQTDELNKFWRDYIPKKYIYKKYQPEILTALFARQKKIMARTDLTDAEKDKKARFLVILDDVISDQRLKYDENLTELFVAGRHYKIMTLITTQYALAITPTIRANTDFVFILKCMQHRSREALWENYGDFLTRDGFNSILDAYTQNNEALVVNTCPDNDTTQIDMLTWWKAVDPGPFKFGSKEFWQDATYGPKDTLPPVQGPASSGDLISVASVMPEWTKHI